MTKPDQLAAMGADLQRLEVTAHGHNVGDIFFDGKQDQYTFGYADAWLSR